MGKKWRFLTYQRFHPALNMAIDEAMMIACRKGLVPPTVRLYGWKPAGLSIGYFQKAEQAVKKDQLKLHNVEMVRRLTGGRAVLHDQEVTYSLISPLENEMVPKSITDSHRWISQGLVVALKQFDLPLSKTNSKAITKGSLTSAACFDTSSSYEIEIDGRKLVGSAQTRQNNMLLQHGSLLLASHDHVLFQLLNFRSERQRQNLQIDFQRRSTSLAEWLHPLPTILELENALLNGFSEGLGVSFRKGALSKYEEDLAERLVKEKYAHSNWTFHR
ncbi:lipoate-protein ligase A [Seinonella peptonophila]|uniref:Lipoate-protein ligase A n=1 Tax=Seinonella peptonophila TaxID=112248 RepID=A0A1M4TP27_9BACL|nr:biotin/lipoate A/B protein ligase family protein [Seinonella peptonophila]SHE46252.1 lipoate-protein ligase A [Seinonella peptonophila]